jgi:hypothetical protein
VRRTPDVRRTSHVERRFDSHYTTQCHLKANEKAIRIVADRQLYVADWGLFDLLTVCL